MDLSEPAARAGFFELVSLLELLIILVLSSVAYVQRAGMHQIFMNAVHALQGRIEVSPEELAALLRLAREVYGAIAAGAVPSQVADAWYQMPMRVQAAARGQARLEPLRPKGDDPDA